MYAEFPSIMSVKQTTSVADDAQLDRLARAAALGHKDAFSEIYKLLVADVRAFVGVHAPMAMNAMTSLPTFS